MSSTELDVGLGSCEGNACSKGALVCSLIILFPTITELLHFCGDMDTLQERQERSGSALA